MILRQSSKKKVYVIYKITHKLKTEINTFMNALLYVIFELHVIYFSGI